MYSGDGGGLAGLNHWNCHILSRSSGRSLGLHRSLTLSRRRILAPHSRPTNNNIIIPERVRIPAIRLPPKVNPGDLRNNITPLPLPRVLVSVARSAGEALDDLVIQPGLDGAVRAEVVLEAFPGAGRKRGRRLDALGGEVGKGGVIGLAVEHEDGALAADAEVLAFALGGVGHGDEGDVGVGETRGGLAGRGRNVNTVVPALKPTSSLTPPTLALELVT